jgi:hypothetical protein
MQVLHNSDKWNEMLLFAYIISAIACIKTEIKFILLFLWPYRLREWSIKSLREYN